MTLPPDSESDEPAIRQLLSEMALTIRSRNVAGSTAAYASDVRSFDVVDPMQNTGADAVKQRLRELFSSFAGDIGFEKREVRITVGGGVAFCHSLNHVSATTAIGAPLDMWWRATLGFRNFDGRSQVTHIHASVPMNVASRKASVGLKP